MDVQVAVIRAIDQAGHPNAPIMAYSSKMASAFYGPFRAAAVSELKGDRKAYQVNQLNGREATRESLLDEAVGADILMVKPAFAYLDIIAGLRRRTLLPIAAYQVSGEYAMIKFAAAAARSTRAISSWKRWAPSNAQAPTCYDALFTIGDPLISDAGGLSHRLDPAIAGRVSA
jgi:delta-aminolevulinic acid dehydratase/porphobilinogen synthase